MDEIRKLALMPKQPDQVKLEEMRRFKLKQKLMYKIIKEILSYLVFVLILLTVAYGNRDYKSHHVNNALTSYFMGGTYAGTMALEDVSDYSFGYSWFSHDLTGAIFVPLNKEMADMIVSVTNPLGIEFCSHASFFFCFDSNT